MLNENFHRYQLDESISNFRVVGRYFSILFKFQKKLLFANSGEPDQMPRFATSDLLFALFPDVSQKGR